MRRLWVLFPVLAIVITAGALFLWWNTASAVQTPTISLDMDPAGNTYDDTTNTMTVGTVDNCLAVATANPATHTHPTHLVINNVEDLVGWQLRLNYVGDQMRPQTQNLTPFTDTTTSQNVGFNNLPIDTTTSLHRDLTAANSIPPAPPDGTNTAQTALIGGVYNGPTDFPISPDTPAKSPAENPAPNYSAPSGGVLTQLTLQVVGNETGNTLLMDLDDGSPNPPGSNVVFFDGTGTTTTQLAESALFDGLHAEGLASCGQAATPTEAPTAVPTPTATAGPGGTPTPTPRGVGPNACKCFNPANTATYCREGTFDIGLGPDGIAGNGDDTHDYNFGGIVDFSPTVPDDTAIPVGAILGQLGS